MLTKISLISQECQEQCSNATTAAEIENIRQHHLGRKGTLSEIAEHIKPLSSEEKRVLSPALHAAKKQCLEAIQQASERIATREKEQASYKAAHFDVTQYITQETGTFHPYTHFTNTLTQIFEGMGFIIADGPEVEHEYNNFTALNIPENHPARDMHDTFWLPHPEMLLRTHTSSVQIRAMKETQGPLALVAPGRCYRHEATDASHDIMFWQCEGIVINKKVSMAELIGTVKAFLSKLFESEDIPLRIRPSYFPFVEPGIEIDMSASILFPNNSAKKWLEIAGAGLIHPNVLRSCGLDPEEYQGFAFGFGLTRLVMLKYKIPDIRLLHNPKKNFLDQFK